MCVYNYCGARRTVGDLVDVMEVVFSHIRYNCTCSLIYID